MQIVDLVHRLQDHDLAVLVSFIAKEHCIITAEGEHLEFLQDALESSTSSIFGFENSTVTINCNGASMEDVVESMIVESEPEDMHKDEIRKASIASRETVRRTPMRLSSQLHKRLANIVICRNLDLASNQVQIQILELIRTRRIFSRKSVYSAPENFLIIALLEMKSSRPTFNHHLSDYFLFSHKHGEEEQEQDDADSSSYTSESMSSVVIRKPAGIHTNDVIISAKMLRELSAQAKAITMAAEMKRYMSNVIVFLRMHRAVASGCSAIATKYFELLVKCLCPIHGQDFVTPALINLAAYKIYAHRIVICTPEQDRSIMWGSDKNMVAQLLNQLTPELIIDSVLSEVAPPL